MSAPTTSPGVEQSTPDGRDARWAAHRVARRRELVEATLRAIRHHGAGVGMDEIAAEARTSKTVVYRHLGDRQGVYLAVCESVDALILSEIEHATRASHRDDAPAGSQLPQMLNAVIDSYLRLVERDPEVYRFVVRRPDVSLPEAPGADDPVTGLSGRIADTLAQLLCAMQAHADAARARVHAWALVGMVKESAHRWLENPDGIARGDLSRQLAAFAYTGLAPDVEVSSPSSPYRSQSTRPTL